MARRRRGRSTGIPKRATLWVPFKDDLVMTVSGTVVQSVDLFANFFTDTGQEIPVGTTITTIRGKALLRGAAAGIGVKGDVVMAALAKVPESSWQSLPDPESEIMDGMWYGQFIYPGNLESATDVFGSSAEVAEVIETKAQRKITATGQELRMVAVADSGVDYTLEIVGNILLKLP